MFADEIRRAIEASNRITLPAVTALLWRAYGEGKVSEAEAEVLSGLIEIRQVSGLAPTAERVASSGRTMQLGDAAQDRQNGLRKAAGSRPRTDASTERRRRWAASGRLPPGLAARFTLAEQAVLSLIAAETVRRGDCRLSVPHIAALVGVAETTVRNAVREAKKLGLLTVEERRLTGLRNDTNVVRIVSPEWQAWLRLARREDHTAKLGVLAIQRKGGGCKSPNRTPTKVLNPGRTGTSRLAQKRFAAADRAS